MKKWKAVRYFKDSDEVHWASSFMGSKEEATFESLRLWKNTLCVCPKRCLRHNSVWGICLMEEPYTCFALSPSLLDREI